MELSADQLAEYQEIGEFVRHDDIVHLTMSSVLVPLLAGALIEAWREPSVAIPLAFGSLVVWLYWFSVKKRRMDFLVLRLKRARELEQLVGLAHHTRLHEDSQRKDRWSSIKSVARIKRIERVVSIALLWAWLLLFVPVIGSIGAAVMVALATAAAVIADRIEYQRK